MDAADLEAIAEVLRGTNIMVLSDEIYAELTYGLDRHISIATLPGMKERTIVVNGFSKSVCHDRLAPGICGWSGTGDQGDDQKFTRAALCRPHHQPVCSYRSATFLR